MKLLFRSIFLLYFLGINPIGCAKEELTTGHDSCYPSGPASKIISVESFEIHYKCIEGSESFSFASKAYDATNFYSVDEIGLWVFPNKFNYASNNFSPFLNIGNEAIACSTSPGIIPNSIKKIHVIYEGDSVFYSNTVGNIFKGDTISEIFEYRPLSGQYIDNDKYYWKMRPLTDISLGVQSADLQLLLKLKKGNHDQMELKFKMIFHDIDGRNFEFNNLIFRLS